MKKTTATQETNKKDVKTTRRSKGEGSYSKKARKDGYFMGQVTIDHDPFTGKPIRKTVYGKTLEERNKKMTELKAQIEKGTFDVIAKGTLDEYFEFWINSVKTDYEPLTITSYKSYYESTWKKSLGSKQLKKITTDDIQKVKVNRLIEGNGVNKISVRVFRNHWFLLNLVMESAFIKGKIQINPCLGMKKDIKLLKKKESKIEKPIFTRDEIPVFMEVIKKHKNYLAYRLLYATGLRISELLGLCWQNIDLENNRIIVDRQLTAEKTIKLKLKHKEEGKTRELPIPISEEITSLLRTHKVQQNQRRLLLGGEYDKMGYDLVFCFDDGSPLNSQSFRVSFERMIKKAGLTEITPHCLRHLFATLMIEETNDYDYVRKLLGHENIETTMQYKGMTTQPNEKLLAEKIDSFGNKSHELNSNSIFKIAR
jgi:integrase